VNRKPGEVTASHDTLYIPSGLRPADDAHLPDCSRLGWRLADDWEVPFIAQARLAERAAERDIVRGLL